MLYQVVAVARNGVIGKDNKLPWHFSSDLKFFKRLTMGQTVIMGRKTFESIGKPLPGRKNFVLSKNQSFPHALGGNPVLQNGPPIKTFGGDRGGRFGDDLRFFPSIQDAVSAVQTKNGFVIGGANIFKETMSLVDGIYLTRIHADFEGDTFYPETPKNFQEDSRTILQENPKLEVIFYKRDRSS